VAKSSDTAKESKAIQACGAALDELRPEGRGRVLRYLMDRFGDTPSETSGVLRKRVEATPGGSKSSSPKSPTAEQAEYETFAELHDAAGPATDRNRALVAAYWQQYGAEASPTFMAKAANDDLKEIGHALANVTMAFNALKATKPALIVQVSKKGSTRQARKTLKVTLAGKRYVEAMIRGERPGEDEA
jgi:hypothetical protein